MSRSILADQLRRSASRSGDLSPWWAQIGDHLTRIAQKLYPVWVVCGPKLADPGHIEVHSQTIYLDGERLLGPEGQTPQARSVLLCLGVTFHEVLHAVHSKKWILEENTRLVEDKQELLAQDRMLLEEGRMEAAGLRALGQTSKRARFVRRALGVTMVDFMVPVMIEQVKAAVLTNPQSDRQMAGYVACYLWPRVQSGVLGQSEMAGLDSFIEGVLGAKDWRELQSILSQTAAVADGDNEGLTRMAKAYRELIGEPPADMTPSGQIVMMGSAPAPPTEQGQEEGEGEGEGQQPDADGQGAGGSGAQSDDGQDEQDGSQEGPGSFAEELEKAMKQQKESQDAELDGPQGKALRDALEGSGEIGDDEDSSSRSAGLPSGRIPDRGVDRPPFPDERQMAGALADRLRRAQTPATRTIDKQMPSGRFNSRTWIRGQFERKSGRPTVVRPWEVSRDVRGPIEAPQVAIVIDTSGSMCRYEGVLGSVAWICAEAIRTMGGKAALSLFGNDAELLHDGKSPLRRVPAIKTGGGTAHASDAVILACEELDMDNPRCPRIVYVISDGYWSDTEEGTRKIAEMREKGIPTVHICIGGEPLGVDADEIVVIEEPSQALEAIARGTIEAIAQHAGPRRSRQTVQ